MMHFLICLLINLGSTVIPCATQEEVKEQLKTEHNIDIDTIDIGF